MTAYITGIGVLSTLGNDYETLADNLLAGRSGIARVRRFDVDQHPSKIAGEISHIPRPNCVNEEHWKALSPVDQSAIWCCHQALVDAGLWHSRHDLSVGLILGVGSEWLLRWEADAACGGRLVEEPTTAITPHLQIVRQILGLRGPAVLLSTACATGNHALLLARRWLQLGWADICLAGACDMNVTPMVLAAFGNLRALSRRNDEPQKASRPFDRDRDGFVLAEGGAMFVLETTRRNHCRSYGELIGAGASSDAYHLVMPPPDATAAQIALREALAEAGINCDEVDYINAHGTGTPAGDRAEARTLHHVFGEAVAKIPVSSTKSMTGHLLTGASALEAVACLAAIDRQAVPPTINLDDPDPDCDLCHVRNEAQPRKLRTVISNAFGFGGSNSCVVFRRAG
ncbi:MAG: 3-oxoacyl-[acyl-carrier-protein] synthase 2 [Gemmatales bacterium]|nr:MAG: 3-oxoacyl-[acyl-carrier-protein] synthase 2 [Gemmatales bacterium]